VRDALLRAASSGLEAVRRLAAPALVLAAFAPAVREAERSATSLNPLGAALQLTLPPAHGATHLLSVLNAPLVHTGHHTHDGGSARAGRRWVQHGQQRLGGGLTVGV
jgi:hypothetical protein